MDDRTAVITIDGKAYDIVCSTAVAEVLLEKYGSIEELCNKVMSIKDLSENASELVWFIELFVNAGIRTHNIRHRDAPLPLMSKEEIELLTVPKEYPELWASIWDAISRGMMRNVQSEEDPSSKNSPVG